MEGEFQVDEFVDPPNEVMNKTTEDLKAHDLNQESEPGMPQVKIVKAKNNKKP